jgi:ATP phosphoribosyltransferase
MTSVPLHDERRFVFALPKGRLGETLDKRLAGTGLGPIPSKENPRALTFPTGDPRVLAVWLKGRDLIRYVARGAATFGVVGSDALGECDDDVLMKKSKRSSSRSSSTR